MQNLPRGRTKKGPVFGGGSFPREYGPLRPRVGPTGAGNTKAPLTMVEGPLDGTSQVCSDALNLPPCTRVCQRRPPDIHPPPPPPPFIHPPFRVGGRGGARGGIGAAGELGGSSGFSVS